MGPSSRSSRTTHLVLCPLTLAVLLGVGCEGESPLAPSTDGTTVQSIAITGTTTLQRPGDVAQLTATATLSDGRTQDITSEASWSVDNAEVAVVNRGLLTGRGYGQCRVTVAYGSVGAQVPLRVLPDGMFMVSGLVTDEGGLPLSSARVSVATSTPALSVSTNRRGQYTLPASGEVEIRAEMDGFESRTQRVLVTGDANLDFRLTLSAGGGLGGMYRLNFVAAAACTLPPEAMRRTYLVRLTESPSGVITAVVISPEMVAWGEAGFSGARDGSRVQFTITDDYGNYAFVELLDADRELHFSGTATGEIGDVFSLTFSGAVSVRYRAGGVSAYCQADSHRLEFAR
jgi:hypothetical protein